MFVYILKLEKGKYYVGSTNNVKKRIQDHVSLQGSEWTKKYPYVSTLHVYEDCDPYDEDKYTLKTMAEFGIDDVRGGSYCMMNLGDSERSYIQRSINGSRGNCFRCGSSNHWVRDCTKHTKCTRCGRNSHNSSNCYAKTHLNGDILDDDTSSDSSSDTDTCSDTPPDVAVPTKTNIHTNIDIPTNGECVIL